jgi:hypothetical protein
MMFHLSHEFKHIHLDAGVKRSSKIMPFRNSLKSQGHCIAELILLHRDCGVNRWDYGDKPVFNVHLNKAACPLFPDFSLLAKK